MSYHYSAEHETKNELHVTDSRVEGFSVFIRGQVPHNFPADDRDRQVITSKADCALKIDIPIYVRR